MPADPMIILAKTIRQTRTAARTPAEHHIATALHQIARVLKRDRARLERLEAWQDEHERYSDG
jgi:hypothetical protein